MEVAWSEIHALHAYPCVCVVRACLVWRVSPREYGYIINLSPFYRCLDCSRVKSTGYGCLFLGLLFLSIFFRPVSFDNAHGLVFSNRMLLDMGRLPRDLRRSGRGVLVHACKREALKL